jgi:hypothetical protein
MAGKTQDLLFESFVEASGGETRSLQEVLDSTAELANSLGGQPGQTTESGAPGAAGGIGEAANAAAGLYEGSANPVGSNVQGTPLSTGATDSGGSTAGSIASTFFESGFGMAALVKGLMGLFGGGSSTPQPLEKYEMPSAIDFESAESGTSMSAADYDQTGAPRTVGQTGSTSTGSGASGPSPQITVNVQAMDAQSFLDRSDDIAQAVRGAMLNMSSINDVVNEL